MDSLRNFDRILREFGISMTELSKEEMFDAFKEGVRDAILMMTESGDGISGMIRTDQFMEQIRQGVYDAIWSLATNATDMPCNDFYDKIKEGVKEAVTEIGKYASE